MRCSSAVAYAALMACASSNTTPASTTPLETVRVASVNGASMMTEIHPGDAAHTATVSMPVERAWAALRAAYDSIAVPVAIFDAATHTVGNGQLRVRRVLGKVSLGKYVNCGSTQGGSSADTYEVQLSVVSTAKAADAGSTAISTTVQAQGRPITLSSEYVGCTSTGALEQRIVDLVRARPR